MSTRLERRVIGKSSNYTIDPTRDRPGTTFTNKGASGAVTFTLPTPNRAMCGWYYRFKVVVDQNVTVAAPTADTLVTANDLAADSLTVSTASQKIGALMEAEVVETANGYQWAVSGLAVGHTYTAAT